ncbi:MAG: molybdenum cofactor biosynthesis protein MoaE [Magnetovibrio sp.]|nr:molybdenum cofactor biosynthesis protein MoaE [Magnetovibrio sp.]
MIRVQEHDFDPGVELELLSKGNNAIGGVCSFIGMVRDFAGDEQISAMTLEHYPGMTEKQLEAIEKEANERWPLDATLIIHRYGRLEPGERIVFVAAASAHREAAFEACHFLIDWLKTKAPFWKKENASSGDQWVEAKTCDDEATKRWEQD